MHLEQKLNLQTDSINTLLLEKKKLYASDTVKWSICSWIEKVFFEVSKEKLFLSKMTHSHRKG